MTSEVRRLSIGMTGVARVFFVVVGLMFAAVGTAFAVVPLVADSIFSDVTDTGKCAGITGIPPEDLPPGLLDSCHTSWLQSGLGPTKLIGLVGIPFALLGLVIVLRALRTAAWLDETRLRLRRAFGTRVIDLSTAEVSAGTRTVGSSDGDGRSTVHRVPTLLVRDRASGHTVRLPLQGAGMDQLPPPELRALADAIVANRPGTDAEGDSHNAAAQLRAMAANPLGLRA